MKKFILMSALAVLILSCKSKSATDTKLDSKTQVAMKGNWSVSSVTYPNSNMIKVNSFDLADSQCFVGSKWKFVSNNNKGNFSLNSPKCTSYSTPITWFVNKDWQFVFKVLDESKAKRVKEGYILRVANLTDNSFQLIDNIVVAGKSTDVVYQFSRN
ncbi:lipocalin family protein [Flavobacterium sp.]|uniref:lipocalin family protein n=1 Tax=Flavobacterium sp. TaxID=239 RepID=UPI0025D62EB2|nr:lipocalin family protein [Flavobacterium sp.]